MEKNNELNRTILNSEMDQEAVMDRVNQTFDKIVQDVRNMIDENNQLNNQQ